MTWGPKGGEIWDTKTLNLSRNMSKFVAWQVASLMKNEQQSQNLLLKVDPRSTFRDNFLQPATNAFVAWQVDHQGEKRETSTQNLQRNNVARQVEAFRISYFAAFRQLIKQSKLRHFLCYASPQFISFSTHF